MNNYNLTEFEAYLVMFKFLEDYYNRTKSDEIGGLLGSMALIEESKTIDSAAWNDWLDALKNTVERRKPETNINIKKI